MPEMVPLVLSGAKTQTRRVIKNQPPAGFDRHCSYYPGVWGWTDQPSPTAHWHLVKTPHGVTGDRLWMREAWRSGVLTNQFPPREMLPHVVWYEADGEAPPACNGRYRPPMFMPRWASRCTLEVIEIRAERLLDISEEDAIAEGISEEAADQVLMMAEAMNQREPRPAASLYFQLWDRINGDGASELNPWLFATTFRKLEADEPLPAPT
jgi:hypothetical protein